ncbi:hypothetical protein KEC56_11015 [Microbacterium sp. YMB-B2]|uniref:Uncharacterized protein n=1 Tax=Microbacterium tenebrionis TaxID=2830665 RepID=A0A9X1LQR7_9MICO|nr:hypothetical protein [Microbacterium tenebrionis]MCC2030036.1 hypothetical protein [Microbacterium tenebrionis]
MSDNYETTSPSGSDVNAPGSSGKVDAAKQEAADLKDTAATQAKDVLGTAKDEAAAVVGEAKTQAKDLYAQTQRELSEQANTQQQRLAGGLRSVSDELGSMATNSEGSGVASDLVQQVSGRLSAAATWLGDRDPGAVLAEVKRYARRKPGTFILAAAIGGIVVGRLTRALTANASDDKDAAPVPAPAPAPRQVYPDPSVSVPVVNGAGVGAPLYSQAEASRPDILGEDGYDRPDTV